MTDWGLWLVVAGALMLAEVFTLTFVLGLLSVAALATALVAGLGAPLALEIGVFAATSAVLFLAVRPFERRHLRTPALTTGTAALTGRMALVTEEVTDHGGRVKLGGESWSARPFLPGTHLPVGTTVSVAKVEGATVVVFAEES